MNEHLLKLIDTLALPLDETAARRALLHFARETGFAYYAYLYLRGRESFAVANYPAEWQQLYIDKNYVRIDPVVTTAKHGPPIFTWSAPAAGAKPSRKEIRDFYADAATYAIVGGLSISVPVGFRERMVFTLASAYAPELDIETINPVMAAVAVAFVHSRLSKVSSEVALSTAIQLSPREAECLRWFAEGMTMADIAGTLGIGARSVREYIEIAAIKLNAVNSRHAVTIATRLGLI